MSGDANGKFYLYTRYERFWHWLQAALIIALAATGFEVHGSFTLLGYKRAVTVHSALGVTWLVSFAFFVFWVATTGEWKQYVPTTRKMFEVMRYYGYGIFQGQPHPCPKTPDAKHNPLQRLTYLALAAALLPLWQYRTLVISLQQQVDVLQRESGQVLTLRKQLEKAVESSRFLVQKKQSRPPMIELLRELTAILPDNTWLERLQIRGETLQLVGQSASASALVSVVEASKWLGDAAFASPVTNDRRTGKERFVLGARVVVEPQ